MCVALFVLRWIEHCCWRTARRLRKLALRVQRWRIIIIRYQQRNDDGRAIEQDCESESAD